MSNDSLINLKVRQKITITTVIHPTIFDNSYCEPKNIFLEILLIIF